ncbi:Crp/Fnr family transcriptional regulator [Aquimarina sp. ERC-38]|uniref:Crp/Fnr family transcriptional regulator n=1 Tax=Aquimarina sp. ERC-38 TaxID=2949996 RepID=UPI0022463F11|nr:Crp/Fnr family transcriptional regulator [Aquimarina sp. ERC-38]UZO82528.1 Crp/Fnr family transcriptional regulator [Aquimarina sp. ERC-38]
MLQEDTAFHQLLVYISQYVTLTEREIQLVFDKTNYRTYLKDQYIIQQGDICKSACFIVSGCTKMFALDKEGQEHIIMFSIENWWTSDLGSFISRLPSQYHVKCLEQTNLFEFTYEALEDLYQEVPKMERFFRKIIERAFVASQKRIFDTFSLTATERYLSFRKTYPEIEQRVPQYMIASYLGITKEFLSKIKSKYLQS